MLTLVLNDYYQTLEKSAHFLFFLLQWDVSELYGDWLNKQTKESHMKSNLSVLSWVAFSNHLQMWFKFDLERLNSMRFCWTAQIRFGLPVSTWAKLVGYTPNYLQYIVVAFKVRCLRACMKQKYIITIDNYLWNVNTDIVCLCVCFCVFQIHVWVCFACSCAPVDSPKGPFLKTKVCADQCWR